MISGSPGRCRRAVGREPRLGLHEDLRRATNKSGTEHRSDHHRIANIVSEEGIEPAPEREKQRTWKQFMHLRRIASRKPFQKASGE